MLAFPHRSLPSGDVPLYQVAEAAHCLHLPRGTVRQWLEPGTRRGMHGPVIAPPLVEMADRSANRLSFHNLVELHVLSTIRQVHGIKMTKVRLGLDHLRKLFETDRPLLHVQMHTDGQALFVDYEGDLIDASSGGQAVMRAILTQYLERIERDAGGQPNRLFPFVTKDDRERSSKAVMIDPHIRSGRPCLVGTNLPTSMIASRYLAGDSIDDLAIDYDRDPLEIEQAIRYERRPAA